MKAREGKEEGGRGRPAAGSRVRGLGVGTYRPQLQCFLLFLDGGSINEETRCSESKKMKLMHGHRGRRKDFHLMLPACQI
jgi:hypothetical protein